MTNAMVDMVKRDGMNSVRNPSFNHVKGQTDFCQYSNQDGRCNVCYYLSQSNLLPHDN